MLSHSRKAYSEAVYRQTTDDFLRCPEGAFRHFGGVPRRLILDNLKAAVKKADWFDPEINPKVRCFGEHYGTVFLPTRPYTPRHKGKVERGVDYVQENALRGRSFASLEEQNRFLSDWERTVADTRVHGTTRRHVGNHFNDVETSLFSGSYPSKGHAILLKLLMCFNGKKSRDTSIEDRWARQSPRARGIDRMLGRSLPVRRFPRRKMAMVR